LATHFGQRYADAVLLASELHAEQLRKGTSIPYVAHLLGVSSLVIQFGGTEDEAIAALLHDAVEDQGGPKARDLIRERFGETVAVIVDGCTDDAPPPGVPKKPWRERKEAYIEHATAERNPSVIMVAAADKIYNANAIKLDLELVGEVVWDRFNASKNDILWYYASLLQAFRNAEQALNPEGETGTDPRLAPLLNLLELVVQELHMSAEISDFEEFLDENDLGFDDLFE
jgi:(p)ppGpp synthase/HD superfamily hydrolase